MTPEQIAADVDRGIFLTKEIERHEAELKLIEARLILAGENSPQVPLQNENLEGKQFIAQGKKNSVPIRFESDQIISSLDAQSPNVDLIEKVTGDKFRRFFKPVRGYARVPKDGEAFRKLGRAILTPKDFAELIKLCTARDKAGIAKSKTVVAWDDAKELTTETSSS